jgi:tetratricopeptide (TPR) repeat protein
MDYPYDLGRYSRKVTTISAGAQCWFDRGLNWCFGYNHEEAIACFEKALEADSRCAMAHWGISYAVGPNYNMPWELMEPVGKAAALRRAHDASRAALALVNGVTAPERALIETLPIRYPQPDPIDDHGPWNDAFADAMRRAREAHPEDLDLSCIFAEAILNRTPWRMWDLRTGEPAPGAGSIEARELLETAFRDLPGAMDHPGLLHLYVHLMEMSQIPEAALVTGDRLRELCPDMGHLAHMPTHIDIQCGHYRDALHWNQKAIVADRKFYERNGPMNFYSGYRVHNYHFATYAAMFLGQYAPAIRAADELIETVPESLLRITSPAMADFFEGYLAIRLHVFIRFGKWREIIAQELPADRDLYCSTVAMTHYAKGVAHAALGDVAAAEAEQELFSEAAKRVPESRRIHNVSCVRLQDVAEEMLAGEIAYRRDQYNEAFAHLRAASALEDDLPYDEPWGWMQPVRHALGALLLEQGRVDEAEAVYREDLGLAGSLPRAQIHPDNLWALRGLLECLERRGEIAETILIRQRATLAAARADVPVSVSCFCARGKVPEHPTAAAPRTNCCS